MKKFILTLILFQIVSCGSPDIPKTQGPDNVASEIENRFEGDYYTYTSYEGNSLELLLKGKKISYINKDSKLEMKEIFSKIKSGDDFIYLVALQGFFQMNTKDFRFADNVKMAIEKKYLLEGPVFLWNNTEKSLKSELNVPVTIKDIDGVFMQGVNFMSLTKEKKMNLQNVNIIIPEKVAQDEGIN